MKFVFVICKNPFHAPQKTQLSYFRRLLNGNKTIFLAFAQLVVFGILHTLQNVWILQFSVEK